MKGKEKMSDWVEEKMKKWGEYSSMREKGVCGFPSQSPTFRVESSGGGIGSVVLVDADVMMVDGIMAGIKQEKPVLFHAGWDWYVRGLTVSSIVSQRKCSKQTVYNRIDLLKELVSAKSRDYKRNI